MSLKEYNKKRDFTKTSEPYGVESLSSDTLRFVIQKHEATRLHFDLRLEMGGCFKSWAVPKGLTQNPAEQRLAVFVEDHPIEYGSFEGIIPQGNYGAGTVMLHDYGVYEDRKNPEDSEQSLIRGLAKGQISFVLYGKRHKGEFILIKSDGKNWLLMKWP